MSVCGCEIVAHQPPARTLCLTDDRHRERTAYGLGQSNLHKWIEFISQFRIQFVSIPQYFNLNLYTHKNTSEWTVFGQCDRFSDWGAGDRHPVTFTPAASICDFETLSKPNWSAHRYQTKNCYKLTFSNWGIDIIPKITMSLLRNLTYICGPILRKSLFYFWSPDGDRPGVWTRRPVNHIITHTHFSSTWASQPRWLLRKGQPKTDFQFYYPPHYPSSDVWERLYVI